MEKQFMTVEEIAAMLGVSKQSAYRLLHVHGLKYTKVGNLVLVRKTDFENWIEQNSVGGDVK